MSSSANRGPAYEDVHAGVAVRHALPVEAGTDSIFKSSKAVCGSWGKAACHAPPNVAVPDDGFWIRSPWWFNWPSRGSGTETRVYPIELQSVRKYFQYVIIYAPVAPNTRTGHYRYPQSYSLSIDTCSEDNT